MFVGQPVFLALKWTNRSIGEYYYTKMHVSSSQYFLFRSMMMMMMLSVNRRHNHRYRSCHLKAVLPGFILGRFREELPFPPGISNPPEIFGILH